MSAKPKGTRIAKKKSGQNSGIKSRRTEVDGKTAEIREHPEAPELVTIKFPKVKVPQSAWESLQSKFDDGLFNTSMNLASGKAPACEATEAVKGVIVKCPSRAVLRASEITHCPTCDRDKKVTKRSFCLPHSALHWGEGKPVMAQMELGETPDHEHDDD